MPDDPTTAATLNETGLQAVDEAVTVALEIQRRITGTDLAMGNAALNAATLAAGIMAGVGRNSPLLED